MTTWRLLLTCWQLDVLAVAACLAAGVAYARADRSRIRPVPAAVALLVFLLALASPIGSLAEGYLFSAHMLQHLLLVLVVPPLALLAIAPRVPEGGAAKAPRRQDTRQGEEEGCGNSRAHPLPSSWRVAWRLRVLAALSWAPRPIVAWGLGVGAMWLWHERTLCDAASQSILVHRLQELSLLAMGTAFWWPVLAPRTAARLPPMGGIVYLFTACAACTVLGILITFSPVRVCSVFAHPVDRLGVMPLVRDGWGLSPETDQQIGGLLMWVPACLVYGVAILALVARLLGDHDDAQPTTEAAR